MKVIKKRNVRQIIIITLVVLLLLGWVAVHNNNRKQVVVIHIGYQSITAQTWGALIVKNQQLFENKLGELYPDQMFDIQWHDEVSGAVINNNMLAHKYQMGYMGDMPCIINLYNAYENVEYSSSLLAFDGKGEAGKNQSILVSTDSGIENISDLKGETISVPVGSSTHRMLLEILINNNMLDEITITHQDIPTAYTLIKTGKITALAAWEPYPTFLKNQANVIELVSGEESNIDYLAGVMIDENWAHENEEIVNLFLECMIESHKLMRENPDLCISSICRESGFEEEIVKEVIENIEWDTEITEKDLETLKTDYEFLQGINQIESFPFDKIQWKTGKLER